MDKDAAKKMKNAGIILILLAITLLAGIMIGLRLFGGGGKGDGLTIDKAAEKWQGDELVIEKDLNNAGSDAYKVYGYFESTMNIGRSANIPMLNPHDNKCYFQFTLILDEDGEVLYKSDWVPPGNGVLRQQLSRALDSGVHGVTLKISAMGVEEPHYMMNGTDAKMKLRVT